MLKNERIIIDTRKYELDEIYERYKQGMIIFYDKNSIGGSIKLKKTKEILQALLRGIPFPPVYVSELQTGQLLVLDKNDRLRFLMEFLDGRFKIHDNCLSVNDRKNIYEDFFYEDNYNRHILYSPIMLHVIDYLNPKYMHMQVGAFIEEWSITQEQSVRNILYKGNKVQVWENILSEISCSKKFNLNMQYNLVYFLMVNFVALKIFNPCEYENADKFQLIENTIYRLDYVESSFLKDLCCQFENAFSLINQRDYTNRRFPLVSPEKRTKYLCFLNIALKIGNDINLYKLMDDRRVRHMIENCDMSYGNICDIVEYFREGNL